MDASNQTEKQHFVPQFYLKNFSDEHGFTQVLDVLNKRIGKPRPYQGVGYADYFYAAKTGVPDEISQHVEEWLKSIENFVARELPDIITKIQDCQHIDDSDRYTLATFMSMLWLRTPGMREQLNRMQEDLAKQLMQLNTARSIERYSQETGVKLSTEKQQKLIEVIESGSYRIKFSNVDHLKFMVDTIGYNGRPGFANMFFGMKWKIYLAQGKEIFITVDSPVVEKWLPPKTFYGDGCSFLEREKYFALTPKILLKLTYPVGAKKVKRETIYEDRDDEVKMLNLILVSGAQNFAYSRDRKVLEQLLDGRENPGRIERAYCDKWERSWDEFRAKKKNKMFIK